MPQGIPNHVGEKFAHMLTEHEDVVLIHARNKEDQQSRYLIFRVSGEPDGGSRMELLGEMYAGDLGRSVINGVEPHPESGIDFNLPTAIPPAYRRVWIASPKDEAGA